MMKGIGYLLFLSLTTALGGFLFGYDTAVISGTINRVSVQFGLDVSGQGWYVGCALVGSILGVSMAGLLSDRFGRKKMLIVSAILFCISSIGCSVSVNFEQLVWYRIVGGIGIGFVSVVSPLYISEISKPKYRGRLVSLYQLAVTIGFLGAYLVNYSLLSVSSSLFWKWSPLLEFIFVQELWRGMLGMGFLPALLFTLIILFVPESPRWLYLKGNQKRAVEVFGRIYTSEVEIRQEVKAIHEVSGKKQINHWRGLLKPKIFKLLLSGALLAILGQFMGVNAVLYYGPAVFQKSGLSDGDSLFYQVLIGAVNMLATVIGILLIDRIGRKKLIYWGVSGMIVTLLGIAWYFQTGQQVSIPSWILLVLFLGYIFSCAISICLVVWVLLSEMYPTKIRGVAMSVAGFFLWIGTFLIGQLTPVMLERLGTTHTFIFFAIVCIPYILVVRYLIPETTGYSLEEIEKNMDK